MCEKDFKPPAMGQQLLTNQYYPVELSSRTLMGEWQECHRWCCEHIGEDHYSWTGGTFWFENERDATLFALRWA